MKTIRFVLLVVCAIPFIVRADTVTPIDDVESYVNIRGAADSTANVVGRLQQGAGLPHVGTEGVWHEVRLKDGSSGFVSVDWTLIVTAEEEASQEPQPVENDHQVAIDSSAEDLAASAKESDLVVPDQPPVTDDVEIISESASVDTSITEVAGSQVDDVAEVAPDILQEQDVMVEAFEAEQPMEPDEVPDPGVSIVPAGLVGPPGPQGPQGPPGSDGMAGAASIEGRKDFVMKFTKPTVAGNSQLYDDGNSVGIGTTEPKQRLEVNGNIQIHARNSSVAGLMITQSSGETGYIMHNRASTLTIGAGSVDRLTIDREGNIGMGKSRPAHPLDMASGAHVTAGGVWTNSSSIANKENIESLTLEEALVALADLEPVLFNYKNEPGEHHIGFIAEDVPELVATSDRKGVSSMDIVAVLTKIVQMQQRRIDELESRLDNSPVN